MAQYSKPFRVIIMYETDGCIHVGSGPVVALQLRG